MRRRLSSFLVRVWDGADGTIRIEIEQIQDGARVVVDSLAGALNWIDARTTARARDAPAGESDPVTTGAITEVEPPPSGRGPGND